MASVNIFQTPEFRPTTPSPDETTTAGATAIARATQRGTQRLQGAVSDVIRSTGFANQAALNAASSAQRGIGKAVDSFAKIVKKQREAKQDARDYIAVSEYERALVIARNKTASNMEIDGDQLSQTYEQEAMRLEKIHMDNATKQGVGGVLIRNVTVKRMTSDIPALQQMGIERDHDFVRGVDAKRLNAVIAGAGNVPISDTEEEFGKWEADFDRNVKRGFYTPAEEVSIRDSARKDIFLGIQQGKYNNVDKIVGSSEADTANKQTEELLRVNAYIQSDNMRLLTPKEERAFVNQGNAALASINAREKARLVEERRKTKERQKSNANGFIQRASERETNQFQLEQMRLTALARKEELGDEFDTTLNFINGRIKESAQGGSFGNVGIFEGLASRIDNDEFISDDPEEQERLDAELNSLKQNFLGRNEAREGAGITYLQSGDLRKLQSDRKTKGLTTFDKNHKDEYKIGKEFIEDKFDIAGAGASSKERLSFEISKGNAMSQYHKQMTQLKKEGIDVDGNTVAKSVMVVHFESLREQMTLPVIGKFALVGADARYKNEVSIADALKANDITRKEAVALFIDLELRNKILELTGQRNQVLDEQRQRSVDILNRNAEQNK
jgi:hypothetical protein